MPVLALECTIAAPLAAVWAFHQDVPRALAGLAPRATPSPHHKAMYSLHHHSERDTRFELATLSLGS